MVNLTNLKVGDTVHLRCGGNIVAPVDFRIDDSQLRIGGLYYDIPTGRPTGFQFNSPFDIISITPKPEPKRIKGFINVYDNQKVTFSATRDSADIDVVSSRYARIACIEIDVEKGEGL